jgi:hypothetical protein
MTAEKYLRSRAQSRRKHRKDVYAVRRTAIKNNFGNQHPIIQGKKTHKNTAGLVPAVSSVGTSCSIGCICFQSSDFDLVEIARPLISFYNMITTQRPSPLILSLERRGRYTRRNAIALLLLEFVLSPNLMLFSAFQISNIHLSNVSTSINFK